MGEPTITIGIPEMSGQKMLQIFAKSDFFTKQIEKNSEFFTKDLTPAALKKLIAQVKVSETDGNRNDLSSEEKKDLVGTKIAAIRSAVHGNDNLKLELQKAASPCAYLSSPLYSEHNGNKLTGMAESMTFNVELLQAMAKTINNCGGELGGDFNKEIEAARVKLVKKWSEPLTAMPGLSGESRSVINEKVDKASREAISKIQSVFHTNPNLVTEIMNLPKVSEQKMNPDEVCQHLPPNNPPSKGQAKIVFK